MSLIIPINKPQGISSYQVIREIKRHLPISKIKIGHAGTLDPFATGVLIIGIGRSATKTLDQYQQFSKNYQATVRLDGTSTTDDLEGEIIPSSQDKPISLQEITSSLHHFIGQISQTPPLYSAVKIKGTPAYKYARQGKTPKLQPRLRQVHSIEIITYQWPLLKLSLATGKGVYIRAIARDLGQLLNSGGYLTSLVRTQAGQFSLHDCFPLSQITHVPTLQSLEKLQDPQVIILKRQHLLSQKTIQDA